MVPQQLAEAVNPRAGARSKPAAQQKPTIDIQIDRHYSSKVYTSGSTISGRAVVRPLRDQPFDDFDIIFTGIAATRLDFVQQYPSHSFRPFMKLRMPLEPSALPESRVFEAGKTHEIPFHFVVPHQLTLGACTHYCTTPAVREQHLRMPPTVGFWEADDQAPEMAQIEYSIKARAYRKTGAANAPVKFMEGYHMVKVLPACPEDAPLDITFRDERYSPSKSKTIRKNLFSAKAGKLTATASQPDAIMLSADGHGASTATARISFEFAPSSADTPPPRITSVSGKLTSATFFGAAPTDLLPNLGSRSVYTANPSLSYTTTSPLFSRSVGKLVWQQGNIYRRRDSGYSSLGIEDVSETDCDGVGRAMDVRKKSKKCAVRLTSLLEIPFSIPKTNRKIFLPTFHSCLISRTYTLHLSLCVGPGNTAYSLAVPVQIGVETIHPPHPNGGLPSFESAMAEDEEVEIDAHLQPRILRVPVISEQRSSMLPGYEEFSRRAIAVT